MAITKPPKKTALPDVETAAATAFIGGAPDAAVSPPVAEKPDRPRRVHKGKKVQISLTIKEPLLDRVDQLAEQIGQSRAAVINLAIMQMLTSGVRIQSPVES